MKKVVLFAFAIMMYQFTDAQVFTIGNTEIGYVYAGPKMAFGGAWISNTKGDNEKTSTLFSYQIGGVGKFGITERLAIQPELLFARKGSKVKSDDFGYEGKTLANYLGIPILAKFSFLQIDKLRFHGSGGIYNNISLSHKTETIYEEYDEEYVHTIEKTNYKKVDFGISIGAGVEWDMDYGLFIGELLIDHGTVDMYTNDIAKGSNRNTSVSIATTFLFDFVDLVEYEKPQ